MEIISKLRNHKIKVITIFLYLITFFYSSDILITSVKTTGSYLKEMFQILPAVFIISGLITVWVPKEIIIKNFGKNSGIKGNLISMFIGSISAGPIYAAFPVTFSLLGKGASLSNVVIIISSWAVIKVPMMIVESKFLGFNFMIYRALFTIPAILAMGYIIGKILTNDDILLENDDDNMPIILEIENALPQYNCGACGYKNCREYSKAIFYNNIEIDKCKIGGSKLVVNIEKILNKNQGGI